MASRYWVGGTGNWSDATNHWATTSGGSPGAGNLPTASDDVFFDTLSNTTAYTVTMDATTKLCNNITFAAPLTGNVTWAGSVAINVSGSLTLYSGLIRTYTGTITFNATTTGKTITLAGISLGGAVSCNGIGGEWTLQDNFTTSSTFIWNAGTVNTNDKTISCSNFGAAAGATGTYNLGASVVTCALCTCQGTCTFNAGSSVINCTSWTSSGGTFNAGTGTIKVTGSGTFAGGGKTFNEVQLNGTGHSITGINTFATLTRTGTAAKTDTMTLSANQTVTGTFTANGNSTVNRLYIKSSTKGTQMTITVNTTVTASNVDFQDINGAGSASWNLSSITGGSGDCFGNSGITFTTPANQYYVGTGTTYSASAKWFTTSGGSTPGRIPLPQDLAIIDSNTGIGGSGLSFDMPRISGVSWTATTGTFQNAAGGCTTFGGLDMNSSAQQSCPYPFAFEGRGAYTLTPVTNPSFGGGLTIDILGGSLTLQNHLIESGAVTAYTIVLTSGTFDTNSKNITCWSFSSSNSNTRSLSLGSSTITVSTTLNTAATNWDLGTATNLSFNAGTSSIVINSANDTFAGGSLTYYNVSMAPASTDMFSKTITGSNTFNNLSIAASGNAEGWLNIGGNQTVNGVLTTQGAGAVYKMLVRSTVRGTQRTISAGTVTASYVHFQDILGTGAGSWNLASITGNSGDCGGNSGITFTTPATIYMKTGVSVNYRDASIWYTTSGGSTGARFPLPQDTAKVDANSITAGSLNITLNTSWIGNLDFTGVTNTPDFRMNNRAFSIFGSMILDTTMTILGETTAAHMTFEGRGSNTLKSAGKTWIARIDMNLIGGTLTLTDDIIHTNTNFLSLTSGTFDTNNKNLTLNGFTSNVSSTRTLNMGSGTWTINGDNTAWNISTATGMTLNPSTSTIKFTGSSATAKAFAGGGLTYNNFWNATGSSGTVTISGNNTFNDLKIDAGRSQIFTSNSLQRVTTFTAVGTAGNIITLSASGAGTQAYISDGSGTNSCDYLSIKDIFVGGGATFNAGANSTFVSNNYGWSELTTVDRYWVTGGDGLWSSTNNWSTTSGGSSGASVPSVGANVFFDGNSGTPTITLSGATIVNNITLTGFTGTITGASLSVYGNIVGSSGSTFTAPIITGFTFKTKTITSAGQIWAGINIGQTPVTASAYLIDTWTIQDDIISTSAFQITGGTFSANNKNVTAQTFASAGVQYRAINMGSGTWDTTTTVTGTCWNFASTNLTLNAGTSTIKFSGSNTGSRTFAGAGLTYNNFWLNNASIGTVSFSGNNTFNDFKCDSGGQTIRFTAGSTTTVTTWNVNGTMGSQIILTSITAATHSIVKAGGGTITSNYLSISYSVVTPSSTWTATNSTDSGNNTGWQFLTDPVLYPAFLLQMI